jgi:hypothetical protein
MYPLKMRATNLRYIGYVGEGNRELGRLGESRGHFAGGRKESFDADCVEESGGRERDL